METITRFTLVCRDTAGADALHAVFGSPAGAPLEAALQAFFAARKHAIHPPGGMGFDHYQVGPAKSTRLSPPADHCRVVPSPSRSRALWRALQAAQTQA